jgi:hypothetical protein
VSADAVKLIVPAYWDSYDANECSAAGVRGAWSSLVRLVFACGRMRPTAMPCMRKECPSITRPNSSRCIVLQEAGKSNVIAVINPNSGPDFTGGDATVKCLPHLKQAGNTLIGYVATGDIYARSSSSSACIARLSLMLRAGPTESMLREARTSVKEAQLAS